MMQHPALPLVLGLVIVAVGAYALYLHSQIKDLALANEAHDMIEESSRNQQAQSSIALDELRQKLEACQTAMNQAPPTPTWWCYRQRECFRSEPQCTQAGKEADRSAECVSATQAWCGGKDGHACFAEPCDCRALEASGGQPCALTN